MKTLTIREVLLDELNWPRKFLSPSGEIARLDFDKWRGEKVTGFKPFCRWQRLLNPSAFLPIVRVLPIGCLIKFDQRLSDNKEFCGLVDPTAYRSFPFGEWLRTHAALLYYPKGFSFGASYNESGASKHF